jgi:hypothetical protein
MAKRKPLVIGASIPIEAIQSGDTLDTPIHVSGPGKVLGRVTAGDGGHEEIDLFDLPTASFADPQTIFTLTGTTETLLLAHAGAMLMLSNANPTSLEIPTNASVAFPVGTHIDITQEGDGEITVTPLSGVTLRSSAGNKLAAKYAGGTLFKRAENEWIFFGERTS